MSVCQVRYVARNIAEAEQFFRHGFHPKSESGETVLLHNEANDEAMYVDNILAAREFFSEAENLKSNHALVWRRYAVLSVLAPIRMDWTGRLWICTFSESVYRKRDGVMIQLAGRGEHPYEAMSNLYDDVTEEANGEVVIVRPHRPDQMELIWSGWNWMDPVKFAAMMADPENQDEPEGGNGDKR